MSRFSLVFVGLVISLALSMACTQGSYDGSASDFPCLSTNFNTQMHDEMKLQGSFEMMDTLQYYYGMIATGITPTDWDHPYTVIHMAAGDKVTRLESHRRRTPRVLPQTWPSWYFTGLYTRNVTHLPGQTSILDFVVNDTNGDGNVTGDYYGDYAPNGAYNAFAFYCPYPRAQPYPCYWAGNCGFDDVTWFRGGLDAANSKLAYSAWMYTYNFRGGVHGNDGSASNTQLLKNADMGTIAALTQTINPSDVRFELGHEYADVYMTGIGINGEVYQMPTPQKVEVGLTMKTIKVDLTTPEVRSALLWAANKLQGMADVNDAKLSYIINNVEVSSDMRPDTTESPEQDGASAARTLRKVAMSLSDVSDVRRRISENTLRR